MNVVANAPTSIHPQKAASAESPEKMAAVSSSSRQTLVTPPFPDLEHLADALKSEISTTLTGLIDTIMAKFSQQRKQSKLVDSELLMKDGDRKSPRTKVIDRGSHGGDRTSSSLANGLPKMMNGVGYGGPNHIGTGAGNGLSVGGGNGLLPNGPVEMRNGLVNTTCGGGVFNGTDATAGLSHARGPQMFAPKLHGSAGLSNAAAAAALYSSMSGLPSHLNPFCMEREPAPEQNEALSLVVIPKKKRHKVTDTRITPRTVSRILAQDSVNNNNNNNNNNSMDSSNRVPTNSNGPTAIQSVPPPSDDSPPPSQQQRVFHQQQQQQSPAAPPPPPPPPMLPVSLPTSVAIPNPSLHESQVFSPYSPFYTSQHQGGPHHIPSSSPPGMSDSPPPPHHHGSLLHPALLAAAQHHNLSPDLMSMKARMDMSMGNDSVDRISECNSGDGPYDGMSPIISFLYKNTNFIFFSAT